MILVRWVKNGMHCGRLCNDVDEVRSVLLDLTSPLSDDLVVAEVILEQYEGE